MKKDCAYTKRLLPKYLRGHLFKFEQIRVARHLNACAVCRSEFQSLKKVADTKQLLQDITPPEGIVQRLKAGVGQFSRLRVLVYRPLWLAAIVGAAVLLYVNLIAPGERQLEIEKIEKTLPPPSMAVSSPTSSQQTAALPVQAAPRSETAASAPAPEPLVVTVTPEKGKGAVRRMNQILRSQPQLKTLRFSETDREVSGSLSSAELLALFDRIEEQAGKVSYSRKRLDSFPTAQSVPFVLKLKPEPKGPEHSQPDAKPASAPTQSVP